MENHHLSLFGIGGLGKTVTLLSQKWEIPAVYIPIRNLGSKGIEDYIKTVTLDSCDEYWSEFSNLRNEPYGERPNLVILLDGLNEVGKEKRSMLYIEIKTIWKNKFGVQLIFASRYDVGSELYEPPLQRLKLEPLSEQQIIAYFEKLQIPVPPSFERIWGILTTPLMLNLYVWSEHFRNANSENDIIFMRDSINAGTVIWNYLQSEIIRYKTSYQDDAIPTIAAMYIAPYLAYEFKKRGVFSLPKRDFRKLLQKAVNSFREDEAENLLSEQITDILMKGRWSLRTVIKPRLRKKCAFFMKIQFIRLGLCINIFVMLYRPSFSMKHSKQAVIRRIFCCRRRLISMLSPFWPTFSFPRQRKLIPGKQFGMHAQRRRTRLAT